MNKRIVEQTGRVLLPLLIMAMLAASTNAQVRRPRGFTPSTGYIGFGIITRGIGGDFDGQTFYGASDNSGDNIWISLVPEMSTAVGFKGVIGYRSRFAGMEFSGAYSKHDWTFDVLKGDGSFLTLGVDLLLYVDHRTQIQPFVQLGVMYQAITVEDGSEYDRYDYGINDYVLVETGDAKYRGIGGRFGGGLQYYINPNLSVRGTALYRIGSMKRIQMVGMSDYIEVDEGSTTPGLSISVMGIFGFGRPAR